VTATRRPRRLHPVGQTPTLRRPIRILRYVNDELLRAGEAIIRSSRAPQPPPQPDVAAGARTHPDSITERADQAA
jgi:hypothetical protein